MNDSNSWSFSEFREHYSLGLDHVNMWVEFFTSKEYIFNRYNKINWNYAQFTGATMSNINRYWGLVEKYLDIFEHKIYVADWYWQQRKLCTLVFKENFHVIKSQTILSKQARGKSDIWIFIVHELLSLFEYG